MPRQVEHDVKIRADDRRFLTAVGHFHKLFTFLEKRFLDLWVELQLFDLLGVALSVG